MNAKKVPMLQQIAKVLDEHEVKYTKDHDQIKSAYSRNGEIVYKIFIREVEGTRIQMRLEFPFVVGKRFMSLVSLYITERNLRFIYSMYKLDILSGRLSLEYNFRFDPEKHEGNAVKFWTYYVLMANTASHDFSELKGFTEGIVPESKKAYYKYLIPASESVSAKTDTEDEPEDFVSFMRGLELPLFGRKFEEVEEDHEQENVLRYFADSKLDVRKQSSS